MQPWLPAKADEQDQMIERRASGNVTDLTRYLNLEEALYLFC